LTWSTRRLRDACQAVHGFDAVEPHSCLLHRVQAPFAWEADPPTANLLRKSYFAASDSHRCTGSLNPYVFPFHATLGPCEASALLTHYCSGKKLLFCLRGTRLLRFLTELNRLFPFVRETCTNCMCLCKFTETCAPYSSTGF